MDYDGVINRNNDISFSDRSHNEQEVLLLISDYVDLVRDLIKTAKENGVKDEVLDKLLNRQTKYHGEFFKPRQYKEIIEGRFDIAEILRIERKNDEHTIQIRLLISHMELLNTFLKRAMLMLQVSSMLEHVKVISREIL